MQKVVADALASSSTKNVAPPVKSKKKGSPLDAIRKDPDALYALLTKMIKEDEAANSDDERFPKSLSQKTLTIPTPKITLIHKTSLVMMKRMLMT